MAVHLPLNRQDMPVVATDPRPLIEQPPRQMWRHMREANLHHFGLVSIKPQTSPGQRQPGQPD